MIFNFEDSFGPIYLICGSILIILDPLWIKNGSGLMTGSKNPGRITSTILFIASNVALIVFYFLKWKVLIVVSAICVVCTGIWYFLSFFPGAKDSYLAFYILLFSHNRYNSFMAIPLVRKKRLGCLKDVIQKLKEKVKEQVVEKLEKLHKDNCKKLKIGYIYILNTLIMSEYFIIKKSI